MSLPEEEIAKLLKQIDTNEQNIYILSGVFGGTLAILCILCIVILVQNSNLKSKVKQLQRDLPWAKGPPEHPQQLPRAAPSKGGSIYSGNNNYGFQ